MNLFTENKEASASTLTAEVIESVRGLNQLLMQSLEQVGHALGHTNTHGFGGNSS